MSDTPRTDKRAMELAQAALVEALQFARQLEIELAAANQHLDAAYEAAGLSRFSSEPLAAYIQRYMVRP